MIGDPTTNLADPRTICQELPPTFLQNSQEDPMLERFLYYLLETKLGSRIITTDPLQALILHQEKQARLVEVGVWE